MTVRILQRMSIRMTVGVPIMPVGINVANMPVPVAARRAIRRPILRQPRRVTDRASPAPR